MSGNTSSKYAVSGAILPLRRCVLGAPRRRSCAQGAGMLRRGPREGPGRWTLHQAFRHRGGRAGRGGQELMRLGMRFARPEGEEPALERMLKASTPSPLY